jgi:hypothetical protein
VSQLEHDHHRIRNGIRRCYECCGQRHYADVQPSGTINIPQGVTQAYQIKLSAAAPAGGVTVNVVSNGTSTATVSPASVTIAQGQTLSTATFAVQRGYGFTTLTLSVVRFELEDSQVSARAGRLAFLSLPRPWAKAHLSNRLTFSCSPEQ